MNLKKTLLHVSIDFVIIFMVMFLSIKQQLEALHVFKCYERYKVKNEDNCWDISRKNELNNKEFMKINHIPRGCRDLQVYVSEFCGSSTEIQITDFAFRLEESCVLTGAHGTIMALAKFTTLNALHKIMVYELQKVNFCD